MSTATSTRGSRSKFSKRTRDKNSSPSSSSGSLSTSKNPTKSALLQRAKTGPGGSSGSSATSDENTQTSNSPTNRTIPTLDDIFETKEGTTDAEEGETKGQPKPDGVKRSLSNAWNATLTKDPHGVSRDDLMRESAVPEETQEKRPGIVLQRSLSNAWDETEKGSQGIKISSDGDPSKHIQHDGVSTSILTLEECLQFDGFQIFVLASDMLSMCTFVTILYLSILSDQYQFNGKTLATGADFTAVTVSRDVLMFVGYGAGNFGGGPASDWLGRRNLIILCHLIEIGFLLIMSFIEPVTPYWWGLFGLGAGIVMGLIRTSKKKYIQETSPADQIAFLDLVSDLMFAASSIIVALTIYAFQGADVSWRKQAKWMVIPSACGLLPWVFLLPESPLYLLTQNKDDEAREVLEKIQRISKWLNANARQMDIRSAKIVLYRKTPEVKPKPDADTSMFSLTTVVMFILCFVTSKTFYGIAYTAGSISGSECLDIAYISIPGLVLPFISYYFIEYHVSVMCWYLITAMLSMIILLINDRKLINQQGTSDSGMVLRVITASIARGMVGAALSLAQQETMRMYFDSHHVMAAVMCAIAGQLGAITSVLLYSRIGFFFLYVINFSTIVIAGILCMAVLKGNDERTFLESIFGRGEAKPMIDKTGENVSIYVQK